MKYCLLIKVSLENGWTNLENVLNVCTQTSTFIGKYRFEELPSKFQSGGSLHFISCVAWPC